MTLKQETLQKELISPCCKTSLGKVLTQNILPASKFLYMVSFIALKVDFLGWKTCSQD